ncbi:MAG: thiamine biosynthesis protein [Desulfuromonadales bacterium]|nr:thiamine biosynthesis protein [Desulfuromonadales bacterium]
MSRVRALSLFSGGLDSILATRVVMEQGIEVVAVRFVTPFFGDEILRDPQGYQREVRTKYGIDALVVDISDDYLQMLKRPVHGFGRYFNPCIDCKIFMLKRARTLLGQLGAAFLISGEVLGQRPMSQRRDTLNVIERDSGNRTILLRPLSALLLNETEAERQGLVARKRLLDFSGRGRSRQIALAGHFGITDFPAPAGGCILADPILSKRIARVYNGDFVVTQDSMSVTDIRLMLVGRQFLLPGGSWLVLGRNEKESLRIVELREAGDALLLVEERPGPAALLRRFGEMAVVPAVLNADLTLAAGLVARYAKKIDGRPAAARVIVETGADRREMIGNPPADEQTKEWAI